MLRSGVERADIRVEGDQGSPRGKILEQLCIAGGSRLKGEGDRAEARYIGWDQLWLDQAVGRAFDIEVIEAEPSSWMVVTAKRGDVLAEFDIDAIEAAEFPATTPVVVSNSKKNGPVIPTEVFRPGELIGSGTDIFTVDPKPAVVPAQTASPASESAS